MADVGGVGEQVAGGEGQGVEVGGEGPRRGAAAPPPAAAATAPGHRARVRAGGVRGEDVDHGLLALAAHDHVEVGQERLGLAGRQRPPGDQQLAAAAQPPCEPEAVVVSMVAMQ